MKHAVFALILTGCAGTFGGPQTPQCLDLDRGQRVHRALAAGAGVLAASTGLPSIVVAGDEHKDVRIGLQIASLAAGAGAATFVLLSDSETSAWVRDCSGAKP